MAFPLSSYLFEVGVTLLQAQLEKGDAAYFHVPITITQPLNQNVMIVVF